MTEIDGKKARMSSVLGESGLVLGNVTGTGDLEVRGQVQGDLTLQGRCAVAETGTVLGRIEALFITVSGTVSGDLLAEDGVSISATASVEGNIEAPRVEIESGAQVRGQLRTGSSRVEPRPEADTAARPARPQSMEAAPTYGGEADRGEADGEDPVPRARRRRRKRRASGEDAISGAPAEVESSPHRGKDIARPPRARGPASPPQAESAADQGAQLHPGRATPARIDAAPSPAAPSPAAPSPAAPSPAAPNPAAPNPAAPNPAARRKTSGGKPPKLPTFVKGARGHLRH